MIYRLFQILAFVLACTPVFAQNFSGVVTDQSGNPMQGVSIYLLENNSYTNTDVDGHWSFQTTDSKPQTLVFFKTGYAYEQIVDQIPLKNIEISLRNAIESDATIREEDYRINGCSSVVVPDDPKWNVTFKTTELKGDLAPNPNFTRRDPSSVIKVNGLYYVWYSYSLTYNNNKLAPWDLNDIYYATSTDGIFWTEKGIAVGRGEAGSFDARSVFTSEILVHDGVYYLVYQSAADKDGIYNRNTVSMAYAQSPDGPWTKLSTPVLYPTYTNNPFFDNNAVHDPCIVFYKHKFYLYYKGECNCRGSSNCTAWCNPVCNISKQVKWGVAIADNPTGPYVKSASNPITNTGHEVAVWPYQNGIAILQHKDGPEALTIQFAENGLDFSIKGSVTNFPEAPGLFRATKSETDPHQGINWGLGHQLKWNAGPLGWMYIYRFDNANKSTSISGISIYPTSMTIGINQERTLVASVEPSNAADERITWMSSNEYVASVDSTGKVTGVATGEAIITAKTSEGGYTAESSVSVQTDYVPVLVDSINVTPDSAEVFVGKQVQLNAIILPVDADDKTITWTSSSESVATVDSQGLVRAISEGSATIKATATDGKFGACAITTKEIIPGLCHFDDTKKYTSTVYQVGGKIDVNVTFNATTGTIVNGDGIKFWLRIIKDRTSWAVVKDYVVYDTSAAGQSSGSANASISLKDVVPSDELPNSQFYFLWVTFTQNDGVAITQTPGLIPIQIARPTRVNDFRNSDISLYPNPASKMVTIRGTGNYTYARIMSFEGARIKQVRIANRRLNISDLKNGLYLIELVGNSRTSIAKLVVSR